MQAVPGLDGNEEALVPIEGPSHWQRQASKQVLLQRCLPRARSPREGTDISAGLQSRPSGVRALPVAHIERKGELFSSAA